MTDGRNTVKAGLQSTYRCHYNAAGVHGYCVGVVSESTSQVAQEGEMYCSFSSRRYQQSIGLLVQPSCSRLQRQTSVEISAVTGTQTLCCQLKQLLLFSFSLIIFCIPLLLAITVTYDERNDEIHNYIQHKNNK